MQKTWPVIPNNTHELNILHLDLHFIREHICQKHLSVKHVSIADQLADILNKPLSFDHFAYMHSKLMYSLNLKLEGGVKNEISYLIKVTNHDNVAVESTWLLKSIQRIC